VDARGVEGVESKSEGTLTTTLAVILEEVVELGLLREAREEFF
jgi:hypothetical protein